MKLEGQGIFGYFTDRKDAEDAVTKLRNAGFADADFDRFHRYAGDGTDLRRGPITGDLRSLAELTMGAEQVGDDSGILLAASADASGLAHELSAPDLADDAAWLVVTTARDADHAQRARRIMDECQAIQTD